MVDHPSTNGRPTSQRAKRCSTSPTGRSASPRPPSACARGACRPTAVVRRRRGSPHRRHRAAVGASSAGTGPAGAAARPARRRTRTAASRGIGSTLVQRALRDGRAARPSRRAAGRRRALLRRASASRARRPARSGCRDRYERHRLLACELDVGRARRRARARSAPRPAARASPTLRRRSHGLVRHDAVAAPHAA